MNNDLVYFYGFRETLYPNLGVGYLVSCLRRKGFNYSYKFIENTRNLQDDINKIIKDEPAIVGLTATSLDFESVKIMAKNLKEAYNPIILLGGAHIISVPQTLPEHVDIGFTGESEETIVDIFKVLCNGVILDKKYLKSVDGIVYWDNGELATTNTRIVVDNLDDIPIPSRDIFSTKYWDSEITALITSRGCPYHCAFCQVSAMRPTCRHHSAEYVVKEILEVTQKYGVYTFGIVDELFILDKKRIKRITELLKQEGLHGKVHFSCNGRANLMTDELVELLVDMGIVEIALGLESMSPRILSKLKDAASVEQNIKAVDTIYRHGIKAGGLFMFGTPTETIDDMYETYKYVKENRDKIGGLMACVTTPLPMTALWDESVEKGIVNPDLDEFPWKTLDLVGTDVISNLYIGDVPVKKFKDILGHIKKMFHQKDIYLQEQEAVGESTAFYDSFLDYNNVDLYFNADGIDIVNDNDGKFFKISEDYSFNMTGLFNKLTFAYKVYDKSVTDVIGSISTQGTSYTLNGTEGVLKHVTVDLKGEGVGNVKRVIDNVTISADCEILFYYIKIDFVTGISNNILPEKNMLDHLESGFYPLEIWGKTGVFWTTGLLKGIVRNKSKGNKFIISVLAMSSEEEATCEILHEVILKLFDDNTGEMVFSDTIEIGVGEWHDVKYTVGSLDKVEYIRFVIESASFVPKNIGMSEDTRRLGLAVKQIAVYR